MSRASICAVALSLIAALFCLAQAQTTAQPPADFTGSSLFPLDGPGVRYTGVPATDPVAKLQRELESGTRKLTPDPKTGYLKPILEALRIPIDSQTLVFSKTSFQMNRIHPGNPRAIYFNDDVYVGYVPGGDVVEISATDPVKGGIFYAIEQPSAASKPKLARRDDCLQCHAAPRTLGIPGHIVRSVYPIADGFAATNAPSYNTDHRSPFERRFGGWYITGTTGDAKHMGNAIAADIDNPEKLDFDANRNWTTLEGHAAVDTRRYLSPHSDVVAHLVLSHQTAGHNYLARAHYEAAQALAMQEDINRATNAPASQLSDSTVRRLDRAAEALLRYFLFTTERKLSGPVAGSSTFTTTFAAAGPKDKKGRSLRDFDLQTRLFRYPLSFLIYSEAFDSLPDAVRIRFCQQLGNALKTGEGAAVNLTPDQRQAIREILIDTKPALRAYL
ncbi:hypothetical protein F183_A52420 [Bryobacterales bacterium F-183]|nr:hypothetical protein F183_A52420 [Bryobacterales bacterium F-183]